MINEQYHRVGKGGKKYWGRLGAGILFTDGKQILLLRRAGKDNNGKWGIPGGRCEDGEKFLDTARRESEEETGVKVFGSRFAEFEQVDGRHKFMVYLFSIDQPFECNITDEHSDWRWVPLNDLDRYELHPNLQESMGRFKKAIAKRFPRNFKEWLTANDYE